MNGYPNHWLSPYTILEKVVFWREIDYDESTIKKWHDILYPFCLLLQVIRERLSPTIRYVKIDRYDTWSMDHTLAHIIHPMLVQLNETKHGAPYTDDEDVPDELKSTNAEPKENEWDTDSNHFKRWDYVLNEMIWTFEQELKDDDESEFFDHSESLGLPFEQALDKVKVDHQAWEAHLNRKKNGFRLFGRYYQNLWD